MAHLRNQFKSMNTFEQSYDYIYYKIGTVVQEEKIFKFCECTFAILLVSPNFKRCGLSIWTNLNSLYPGMLFAKFGWNWPSGSTCKFSLFCNYLPLKICMALHLNKLMYPSTKDDLCQDDWNWTSCSGEEDFLKSSIYFHYFIIISPWKKEKPQVWLKLTQWFLRRRWKC